jgi:toxin ParE1/3/4
MTLPVVYRPAARDDIQQVRNYYEARRPGLGDRFLAAVGRRAEGIAAHPLAAAVVYRGVRAVRLYRFPQVVYYRVEADRVVITAVIHGKRHPRRWRRR